MLKRLTARQIILIDHLEIDFASGLCVLTGETGAGKSILLDALGLALGARGSQSYIRAGAAQSLVCAEFLIDSASPTAALLQEHGLALPESAPVVLLRRVLQSDGQSRCFVNDIPVSLKILQSIGRTLVEVHGQFDQLLDPAAHRACLDATLSDPGLCTHVATAYTDWQSHEAALTQAQARVTQAFENEAFLKHALADLETLDMQPDEEETLTHARQRLTHQAKYHQALDTAARALTGEQSADAQLYKAQRALEKILDLAPQDTLTPIVATLGQAIQDVTAAAEQLQAHRQQQESGYDSLEKVEDRLFQLRATARKYGCLISQLPQKREDYRSALEQMENRESVLAGLEKQAHVHKERYQHTAQALSAARAVAARHLDHTVMQELPPLKLERATFQTTLSTLPDTQWGMRGIDKVQFEVVTNPGAPAGPLSTIASGGERSRFMLAIKVALADRSAIPTLIFDEIDQGVGGAVAHAIGQRLAQLAKTNQVLSITHAPQVAALAQQHLYIEKHQDTDKTQTRVRALNETQRTEEIARMLSGDVITDAARAAATQLLQQKDGPACV